MFSGSWPPNVLKAAALDRGVGPVDRSLLWMYDAILNHVFCEPGFFVEPQGFGHCTTDDSDVAIEYDMIYFSVFAIMDGTAVQILHLVPYNMSFLSGIRTRGIVDRTLRAILSTLADETELPKVYAICAFGSKMAFYSQNKQTGVVEPEMIPVDKQVPLKDTAPLERWKSDIMLSSGYNDFLEVVREIKAMLKHSGQLQVGANFYNNLRTI